MWVRGLWLAGVAMLTACASDDPTIAARPPTPGLSPVAALGEQLFRDETLSVSARLSCETCHRPEFAHAAPPADLVSNGGPAMDQPGIRNTPSIRYASFTPPFGFDAEGTAFGGLFRDGRVPTLAAQAGQPFLDPREMANAAPADVIAQYEVENPDFHRFDSKYGAFLAGKAELTDAERHGLELFEDPEKGNCAACHPNRPAENGAPPLFTDFTYDNVGVPRNVKIPANADAAFFDLGLRGPVRHDLAMRRDTDPGEWYPREAGGTRKFDDLVAFLETLDDGGTAAVHEAQLWIGN